MGGRGPAMNYVAKVILVVGCLGLSVGANVSLTDGLFKEGARVDYLIIAPNDRAMLQEVDRFAEWKWKKGLKTAVVTLDSITSVSPGRDTQEKIRNFLQTVREQWGIMWVLLAGDLELIPARKVSASGYAIDEAESDVYYGCLDDLWEPGEDGIYGNEMVRMGYTMECTGEGDERTCTGVDTGFVGLDLWYDVYLGRLPASNADELKVMIDKIIDYRLSPREKGDQESMLMMANKLHYVWTDYSTGTRMDDATYYWNRQVKPRLMSETSLFKNVKLDELYEDSLLDNGHARDDSIEITPEKMDERWKQGYNLVFFSFHGYPKGIRICSWNDDEGNLKPDYTLDRLKNLRAPAASNVVSISCCIMKMVEGEQTCFAKTLLTNPHGGAVSYTGSSGLDYFSMRGRMYKKMTEIMAEKGVKRIAKAAAIANVQEYTRHNLMVHQHWGDPELPMWTTSVARSDSFRIEVERTEESYQISVFPAKDSVLVCMYKKGAVFRRGYAINGTLRFDSIPSGHDDVMVTATATDYLPGTLLINTSEMTPVGSQLVSRSVPEFRIVQFSGKTCMMFSNAEEHLDIRLFDMSGAVVGTFRADRKNTTWELPSVGAGLYVMSAVSENRVFTKKFTLRN